ncbi:acyltransferase family protein [Streptomyces sp. NRRL F-5630]|uniref:acyltransferase family protein n=1 Tax=Streptomyces sp. NRRL F-5630 TaxID=1463864 RepID=UPI003D75F46A
MSGTDSKAHGEEGAALTEARPLPNTRPLAETSPLAESPPLTAIPPLAESPPLTGADAGPVTVPPPAQEAEPLAAGEATRSRPADVAGSRPPDVAGSRPGRDRYLDLLRSVALVRVVFYHVFGWAWLSIVFPSMGVMFALAGSLMARSLARPAVSVIRGRLRRLLPPLWLFAALLVPAMLYAGWRAPRGEGFGWWLRLATYLVPLGTPPYPGSLGAAGGWLEQGWAEEAAVPLWYLRAYLWFVIASPLLLKALRRAPWPTLLAPVALTAVIGTGVVTIPGDGGPVLTDFAQYGSCWVLGMAYREGLLRKVPRYLAVSLSGFLMAFGLWWALSHQGEDGFDLNDIPLAQATWSLGFTVILLQYAPSWKVLPARLARLDRFVTLTNNRAVTIYLWHNLLILATVPLIDLLWRLPVSDGAFGTFLGDSYVWWMFVVVWPLIALVILLVGWVEDVAAKRRPRLWPDGGGKRRA